MAEEVHEKGFKRVGVLATEGTVRSNAFVREIHKLDHTIDVFQQSAPLLVPLLENGGQKWIDPILEEYIRPLEQYDIDALLLGCTHYPILKTEIKKLLQKDIALVCQDDILPGKLQEYLKHHSELETQLGKDGNREFLVTDITPEITARSKEWFGEEIELEVVEI